jgi:transcriptional regulator with XRE-family HTH domain
MPPEPPVLRRLKALGLSQREIAAKLGASPAAVSMWCTGKNPFDDPWRTEAFVLLAVLTEHLAQGGTPRTLQFTPSVFMNAGGTTLTGAHEMPLEDMAEELKLRTALQGRSTEDRVVALEKFHARTTSKQVAERLDINPLSWTPSAHELDDIRRIVEAVRLYVRSLLLRKAQAILAEEEPHADQTP